MPFHIASIHKHINIDVHSFHTHEKEKIHIPNKYKRHQEQGLSIPDKEFDHHDHMMHTIKYSRELITTSISSTWGNDLKDLP